MNPWDILGWILLGAVAIVVLFVLAAFIYGIVTTIRENQVKKNIVPPIEFKGDYPNGILDLGANPLGRPVMMGGLPFQVQEIWSDYDISTAQQRVRLELVSYRDKEMFSG